MYFAQSEFLVLDCDFFVAFLSSSVAFLALQSWNYIAFTSVPSSYNATCCLEDA